MLGPLQQKWLEALESGKYKQCQKSLNDGFGHCCLGVMCEVLNIPKIKIGNRVYYGGMAEMGGILDERTMSLMKLTKDGMNLLIHFNDKTDNFDAVIKYIKTEENHKILFSELI